MRRLQRMMGLGLGLLLCVSMTGARAAIDTQEGNGNCTVEAFGAKALLPGRDFTITVKDVGAETRLFPMTRFCVVYQAADGGTECYGLISEIWTGGAIPWSVITYEKKDANGRDTFIVERTYSSGFRVYSLPLTGDWPGGADYPAYVNTYLAYMDSIGEFPTSEAQAMQMAEESWKRFEGTDLAMTAGVNLRQKASTSSPSLGGASCGRAGACAGAKAGEGLSMVPCAAGPGGRLGSGKLFAVSHR